MTIRLGQVERSLAARGVPLMWANEQEAAVLSGVGPAEFRQKVKEWEKKGFPRVTKENRKRYIPAIVAFWATRHNLTTVSPTNLQNTDDDDDDDVGTPNFG